MIIFYRCHAQKYLPPPIGKAQLVTESGIEYQFSKIIESRLNNKIKEAKYGTKYIQLDCINDSTWNLTLYCFNSNSRNTLSNNPLIKNTGRYYLYQKEKIAIIFNADYIFSTPNFIPSEYCYMITFKYKNGEGIILHEE